MLQFNTKLNTIERIKELNSNLQYLSQIDINTVIDTINFNSASPLQILPIKVVIDKNNINFDQNEIFNNNKKSIFLSIINFFQFN